MDKLKSLLTKKLTPEQQKKEDEEFAEFLKLKKAYDEYNKLAIESARISSRYPRGKFIHMKDDRDKVEALTKKMNTLRNQYSKIPTDSADWPKIEKRWKGRKYGGRRTNRKLGKYRRTLTKSTVRKQRKTTRKRKRSSKNIKRSKRVTRKKKFTRKSKRS